ncbi:MAG: serine/threonine-protein kinase, partial [Pseudonocardia sp.]
AEKLSENTDDGMREYRARNHSLPGSPPQVRLRVHPLDPYLPEDERLRQRRRLGNAYSTLSKVGGHPHVIGHRDYFIDADERHGVLVLDDVPGRSLRLRLADAAPLARDEAVRILRDTASGLVHAHRHDVVHRALSPDTVLLAADGRALLTGFDHARGPGPRETVVNTLPDVVDPAYLAPEGHTDIRTLTPASDVYAFGVLAYRLLTGELPFESGEDQHRRRSVLPDEPLRAAGVPDELLDWVLPLCALDPGDRPSAQDALRGLDRALRRPVPPLIGDPAPEVDLRNLQEGHPITSSMVVRERLGTGSFGVVYRVHNVFARTDQVLKLVLTDSGDLVDRLGQEYRPLLALPEHPNVVRVHHADLLPGWDVPYLVFEYVPGHDVAHLASRAELTPADVRRLGIDAATGLAHIHAHHVFHCDVKPNNVLWTDGGARLIDFNVAVSDEHLLADAGSARYLPPDYASHDPDLVDRDVYALGLTLYEALTRNNWPWDDHRATSADAAPRDPRTFSDLSTLTPEFVDVLLRAIRPTRADRYPDATAFATALRGVTDVRRRPTPVPTAATAGPPGDGDNPFVTHLQTLYSQSRTNNSGTRGLDREYAVYVDTLLDQRLIPDVLAGTHQLVIITGNAGDGKTAFLERLVRTAADGGATLGAPRANG